MRIKAINFKQCDEELYLFAASAKDIWKKVSINQREEDKVEGYQRALSPSRAQEIKAFMEAKNVIAPAIVIAFEEDKVNFDPVSSELVISDDETNAGWVIDGQHRLRGADLSEGVEDNVAVVAFIGLELKSQIAQFVTINREGKGVPTSLYYDLLKMIPKKKAGDVAKEKAAAIADALRKNKDSIFFDRIVVVTTPKAGEISLTNFVRKVSPLIVDGKGQFSAYSQQEVTQILENYFKALRNVYPDEFSLNKQRFFKTLGFGAVMNALHPLFLIITKDQGGFRIQDIEKMLRKMEDFKFSDWDGMGTGSAAEIQAGKDFEAMFKTCTQDSGSQSMLKLL